MKKIIINGDFLDKGVDLINTIEFIYKNWKNGRILLTIGNHENYVYKALKGQLINRDKELEKLFFDSINILEKNEILRNKFFEIFEGSKEFLTHRDFIVTHAPCKEDVLGKVTPIALKNQRNLIYPKRADFETDDKYNEELENYFSFLNNEAKFNNPLHIMGHVAIKEVVNFKNKYMIDTGCAAGGRLTSIHINKNGKPYIQHVDSLSKNNNLNDIVSIYNDKDKVYNLSQLEPEDRTRIKYLIKDKINFISGTMSPSDKNEGENDIESLNEAIKYYQNLGIEKLILQPKYMGSRGNLYLFKDIEQTYLVSRNGYKIKENYISHEEIIRMAKPYYEKFIEKDTRIKMILLDCEILPWKLMGKGLIDQQFTSIGVGVKSEINLLNETGFEVILNSIKYNNEYLEYIDDIKIMNKEQLTTKYGNTKERTFRNYNSYIHIPLLEEKKYIENYDNQVYLYTHSDIKNEIKPFSILKIVYEDDTEITFENQSNIEIFEKLKDDDTIYGILDFKKQKDDKNYMVDVFQKNIHLIDNIDNFYNLITLKLGMEGVVVKPEKVYNKGIAPYLKVRNKNYLTIVYGHNYKFEKKYNKLLRKKNIKRKLRTSISEFELGIKMLQTPYHLINEENEDYKQLLAQMIIEINTEQNIDPRL